MLNHSLYLHHLERPVQPHLNNDNKPGPSESPTSMMTTTHTGSAYSIPQRRTGRGCPPLDAALSGCPSQSRLKKPKPGLLGQAGLGTSYTVTSRNRLWRGMRGYSPTGGTVFSLSTSSSIVLVMHAFEKYLFIFLFDIVFNSQTLAWFVIHCDN